MKTAFLFCLLLSFASAFSQFAVIDDKDGFAYVRRSASIKNNVSDKLANGHIVWCFEKEENWMLVDYIKKNEPANGYIYHDRAKIVSSYKPIPVQKIQEGKAVFKNDSITIIIARNNFNVKKNVITRVKNDEMDYVAKINGKEPWGTDGNIPNRTYESIIIQLNGKQTSLPKKAIDDLYEPNFVNTECFYDSKKDVLYITSINSDGAGAYAVMWVIEKGVYKKREVLILF